MSPCPLCCGTLRADATLRAVYDATWALQSSLINISSILGPFVLAVYSLRLASTRSELLGRNPKADAQSRAFLVVNLMRNRPLRRLEQQRRPSRSLTSLAPVRFRRRVADDSFVSRHRSISQEVFMLQYDQITTPVDNCYADTYNRIRALSAARAFDTLSFVCSRWAAASE